MTIKTPTSFASTHCLLPQPPDPSTMSLTVSPEVGIVWARNSIPDMFMLSFTVSEGW